MHSQDIHRDEGVYHGNRVWDDDGEVDDDRLEVKDDDGTLEVDDSVLQGRGRRATCLRSMTVCFASRMRQRCALRPGSRRRCSLSPGMRRRHAPGPRSRTASDGSVMVFEATKGQALSCFKKLLCVTRESAGLEILGHEHPMRDTPLLRASPFS
jgi:hypothetical protein